MFWIFVRIASVFAQACLSQYLMYLRFIETTVSVKDKKKKIARNFTNLGSRLSYIRGVDKFDFDFGHKEHKRMIVRF